MTVKTQGITIKTADILGLIDIITEKKNEIWLSPMTKASIPTDNLTTNLQHKKATKTSIKQRLRTDLGRSVEVTKAIQLVWLIGVQV